MKRKAIKLSSNTLVVSLPAKWVALNNIQKGSVVEVTERANYLLLKKGGISPALKSISIDISGMSTTLLWNFFNSLYTAGYEEMRITFSSANIKNIKTGQTCKTIEVLSRICDTLIGMEIIRQSKDSVIIKQVTDFKEGEFDNVLNRLFMSLSLFAEDLQKAISEKDKDTLNRIATYSEININKLALYCLRFLNTEGRADFIKSNSQFSTVISLEQIGDTYSDIASICASRAESFHGSEVPDLIGSSQKMLKMVNSFVSNPKMETLIEFHNTRNSVKKKIRKILSAKNLEKNEVLQYIIHITDLQREICNFSVAENSEVLSN